MTLSISSRTYTSKLYIFFLLALLLVICPSSIGSSGVGGIETATLSSGLLNKHTPAVDFIFDSHNTNNIHNDVDILGNINNNDYANQQFYNRSLHPVNVFETGMVDRDDYDPHHMEHDQARRRLAGGPLSDPNLIINLYDQIDNSFNITFDPPVKTFSPTALGLFVYCKTQPSCKIYYELSSYYQVGGKAPIIVYPTLTSPYASQSAPYIHVDTPYLASRNRTIIFVGVYTDSLGKIWRSKQYELPYFVEASNRALGAFFLVPGLESSGNFLRVEIEVKAKARAQTAGGQEFADFFTKLGVGPYDNQVQALHLPSLNKEFNGYEGGVSYYDKSTKKHFGIIAPHHNGRQFHGYVVRVNLRAMSNATSCLANYRIESLYNKTHLHYSNSLPYNSSHRIRVQTPTNMNVTRNSACTFVLKLHDVHPRARGFKKLFLAAPYVYLSPGEYDVPTRIDIYKFGLDSVKTVDLMHSVPDMGLGGYSGGFKDGIWSCFVPFRTFFGPVGGTRSNLEVDKYHLRSYHHGKLTCLAEAAYENSNNPTIVRNSIRTIELSDFSPEFRGFSDGIRVGRYAYLSPYEYDIHTYTGKMIRIDLGYDSIGDTIDKVTAAGLPVSTILNALDLAKINPGLKGFSSIFTAGQFVYLVPLRNVHEPQNGQRGHGNFIRIDMNNFNLIGVEPIDIPATTRTQIPSFADVDLRGFSHGFASGKYGVLVPFFNAVFSGKCARLVLFGAEGLADNLQELDLVQDYYGRVKQHAGECKSCDNSFKFKGFRGGFTSLWPGVEY